MMDKTGRNLRIAHMCFSALPATVGGMEVIVDNLIRWQTRNGHHAALVTRWNQAKALRKSPPPYPVHGLIPRPTSKSQPYADVGWRWPIALSVAAHQLRHRFDVWHAHWVYPTGWMAQGALRPLGVPLVMTAHGADINVDTQTGYGFRQFPKHDARVRSVLANAPFVTAVSPLLCDDLKELGAKDVRLISNGIASSDIQAFSENAQAIRARLNIPVGAALILTVARNDPSKGLHHIPKALSQLKSKGLSVVWAIVGPGSGELAPIFADAGLSEDVRLIAPVKKEPGNTSLAPPDELVSLYKSADIFVFPSHSESFGLVALEAMAAGTPVVASDISGLQSFVRSGENGILVPAGDPAAIAEAVMKLVSDPQLCATLARNGTKTSKQYDWDQVAEKYTHLYHEAIESNLQ